ncbi:MAG TPA: GTPase Era [Terriglobales bacterium]|nr:GTPase Era [Terriglobales bacterium]
MRSGFATIIGRPNAGKSTLLNALVGSKIAIVTHKPQTTRNRVQGIINLQAKKGRPAAQVILIDTPGVHRPDTRLNQRMMQEVREGLEGCDLVLLITDVTEKFGPGEQFVINMAKKTATPTILLLNKIDRIPQKDKLLFIIDRWRQLHDFKEVIPISALKKDNLDVVLDSVVALLPEGPAYFPSDQVTDQPLRFLAAEMVREQVLLDTEQELPYSTTVIVEQFEEEPRLVRIAATIYCERDSQKPILIGKNGQMLKKIGTDARKDIETMLGKKVFLELFVKVRPGWRESRQFVEELDWRRQIENMIATNPED